MRTPRTLVERRRRQLVVLAVVCGVTFVTAGVALLWGANEFGERRLDQTTIDDPDDWIPGLRAYPESWPPPEPYGAAQFIGGAVRITFTRIGDRLHEREEWALGWPAPVFVRTKSGWSERGVRDETLVVLDSSPAATETSILWGPLLTMSFAAAALCAGLIVGIPWLRDRRRLASGLCPMCRYPRGASETCTECGFVHGMVIRPPPANPDPMGLDQPGRVQPSRLPAQHA